MATSTNTIEHHSSSDSPDNVPESDESKSATRQNNLHIIGVLVGGVLLLCSFAAQLLWRNEVYATLPAAIAVLLLGLPLAWDAIRDVWHGRSGMSALVALAVIGSAAIGHYQESAAIAFFMLLSSLIENRTAIGAQASIESLVRLTPTKAVLLRDGEETNVEAQDLKAGDIVRVRPGDNIPADGEVISGQSTVNQANITGESLPIDKTEGDEVFGGTINVTGAMDIRVLKAGADTTLGRVKDLILQAELTRTPLIRMIDKYAGWYTPTILMLTGAVLFFSLQNDPTTAFTRAIAMLVIACPSALILATPTAMVAALSAAARLGVLIKSVVTLEVARNLTAIVFDKTGTLTTGVLTVTQMSPSEGVSGVELLEAAAAAERNSRHPVARAVTAVARKARLSLPDATEFNEVVGRGVRAVVTGSEILVGRATWLTDESLGLGEQVASDVEAAIKSGVPEGLSVLFVVRDRRLLGWIGLEDNARPEAPGAIDQLRHMGMRRLIILTGDRASVARRVAAQMHFEEFKAEVLPHEKLEMVDHLKARGHRVAVVGDGVNDAPALAAGDISIAMGAAGSDVAIHSASIALMSSNLNRIPFLIDLSRRTISIIRQNLILGGAFIVVFIALAAGGYVTPVMASILHVISGLIVIFNSARLVRAGEAMENAEVSEMPTQSDGIDEVQTTWIDATPAPALANA